MGWFVVVVIVAVFLYFLFKSSGGTGVNRSAENAPAESPLASENQIAVDALTRIYNACQASGGDGFSSLIVAASSDGKVSRDELRVVMWFCEGCGAAFSSDDVAYVSKLNSGVSMDVTSNQSAQEIVAMCGNYDLPTLLRLHAAHAAIGKPWNKTARRSRETLAEIERLVVAKSMAKTEVYDPQH